MLLLNQLLLNILLSTEISAIKELGDILFKDGKLNWILLILFAGYFFYKKFIDGDVLNTLKKQTVKKIEKDITSGFQTNMIYHLNIAQSTIFSGEENKTFIFQSFATLTANEFHNLQSSEYKLLKASNIFMTIGVIKERFRIILITKYGEQKGEQLFNYIYPATSVRLKPVTEMAISMFTELERSNQYTNYDAYLIINGMVSSILTSMVQLFDEFNGKINQIIENGNTQL